MNNKTYSLVVTIIFSIIGVLHLMRLIFRWDATIGGWTVPFWLSWIFIIVAGYIAYVGFKLSKT